MREILRGDWREMFLVLMALYPIVVGLTFGINAVWGAHLWAKLLLGNVASVVLLSLVTLPLALWFMRHWHGPARDGEGWKHDVRWAAVAVGVVAVFAVIFWRTTPY